MEIVENRADNDEDFPISIPKDYFQTANEICYIGKKSLKKKKIFRYVFIAHQFNS